MLSRTELFPVTEVVAHRRPSRISEQLAVQGRISLSEVLSALSCALDLTEGAPAGHSMRTCLIGMRIAEAIGLEPDQRSALYYALLLKDAGCSSNAGRIATLFGADDQAVKPRMKSVDWHARLKLAIETARAVAPGRPFRTRLRQFVTVARTPDATRELIRIRCDRGAAIAFQLGFPEETARAIRSLDEHWCGRGYAEGLAEERIPLLARIANLAQTVEVFHDRGGVEAAHRVVRERSGRWFDPTLARIVLSWRADDPWWALLRGDVGGAVVAAEPADRVMEVDEEGLDGVARAFADIIDAKSPFTFRHSTRVATIARRVAERCGLDAVEQRRIYRAGLLHDVGKLGISSRILDKNGAMTEEEREQMERHPQYTLDILERVSAFRGFARTAALHHERLDGSGYPFHYDGEELDLSARILCVVDIYDAISSDRPYRKAMVPAVITSILERDRGTRLCPIALDALHAVREEMRSETAAPT
jgi:HD-GYP domain-containing protein (c-di-GMP phosphodiesterase class II)